MYFITGWTLIYFIYEQFSDEWVQALYTVPSETDKVSGGRYCDILIYVILLATCYYLWRLLIACLWRWKGRRALADHVSVVWKFRLKAKKELCFSHGSHSVLKFASVVVRVRGLWLHPVFRFTHQRIQNGVERKRSESTTKRGSFQGELLQWQIRAAVRQYSKAFLCRPMLKQLTVCWAHCLKTVPIKSFLHARSCWAQTSFLPQWVAERYDETISEVSTMECLLCERFSLLIFGIGICLLKSKLKSIIWNAINHFKVNLGITYIIMELQYEILRFAKYYI